MRLGAQYAGGGRCRFTVWAPNLAKVEVKIVAPEELCYNMEKDRRGYWSFSADNILPGTLYYYRLDQERDRPDPASSSQPQGVHGPSQIIEHSSFDWGDKSWKGVHLHEMIMYELHVGTFTPEGTFDAVIPRLCDLKELGVNTIEVMPVAQFPGERNWGYDGTYPFAVQNSYGGPEGLKRLVNECHKEGISVILDVVYNHLGPEGNYLWDYGPYFTDKYRTPWGQAINFDDAYSNEVRNYFIENALQWFAHYHIDALRLDAIHGIADMSARPFLLELAERTEEFCANAGRKHYLIAESDLNDSRVIRKRDKGGDGLDAQWCDDFHHCIHTILTGESDGYYIDFGTMEHLARSLKEGFVYSGRYSEYRKRNQGNSSSDLPAEQFVVFSQNHDQIGNRMLGERLSGLLPFESLKLAAGIVLLSPFVPLFFMGEEYGEEAPFLYFISHSDHELVDAVRRGRKEEFKRFTWKAEPPDPQSADTFMRSKIQWEKRRSGRNRVLLNFYRELIALRTKVPALANLSKTKLNVQFSEEDKTLFMTRWKGESSVFITCNFSNVEVRKRWDAPEGSWKKILDSSDTVWEGPGAAMPDTLMPGPEITLTANSVVIFLREVNS
ncbi:MAG: malto-oligosyltrehalose trehalohydrolase [Nitrospiraceae bacterium]|nr:MAG: malto-oligosyltrehalose trehalohydrolase [Nitrospiraceae bacterium]